MNEQPLPGFVASPRIAVSGRMMSSFGSSGRSVPCVLIAYHMPTWRGLGSAVYVLGAVGPSVSSFPFWPLGGVIVHDGEMQILYAADDNYYNFENDGAPVEFDAFEHEIDSEDSLFNLTLRLAAERLELQPWDTEQVSEAIADSEGWDHFDEFMALPIQEFPTT
jgi:hypothetical protein